jgi:hypothetical protein
MDKIDWSKVTLRWYGKPPAIENYEELVLTDCENNLWGLSRVSDLTYHLICLSNSYEYDIITVWGQPQEENILHCEYEPKPKWISLREMKNKTEG